MGASDDFICSISVGGNGTSDARITLRGRRIPAAVLGDEDDLDPAPTLARIMSLTTLLSRCFNEFSWASFSSGFLSR